TAPALRVRLLLPGPAGAARHAVRAAHNMRAADARPRPKRRGSRRSRPPTACSPPEHRPRTYGEVTA
ncbi:MULTISPECIES: hypothetical protein, partial [unclassified Streptomyces]|uniref:hypothetical protein n=1 Tax=unclassified Streptomyces TaxID=2593676 RepID=UPI001961F287